MYVVLGATKKKLYLEVRNIFKLSVYSFFVFWIIQLSRQDPYMAEYLYPLTVSRDAIASKLSQENLHSLQNAQSHFEP